MSRANLPKQLIPFIGGKSLLQLAYERLEDLVPAQNRYICAGQKHADVICRALGLPQDRYLGEPIGRDTLNAVGLSAAVIARRDPDAVIAVFTADHIIEPVDQFQKIVDHGYRLAEKTPNVLVTFGITPTTAATSYGYLQLGDPLDDSARVVEQFKEKPDADTALRYCAAGPQRYLWNSGMFVWRAATLLDCIRRYEKANFEELSPDRRCLEHAAARGRPVGHLPEAEKDQCGFRRDGTGFAGFQGARGRRPDAIEVARCWVLADVRRDLCPGSAR